MKKIFLTIIFIVTINFNASASNAILDDLKKFQYTYINYVLEKIRTDLKYWLKLQDDSDFVNSDTYGLNAFSLSDVHVSFDDENILFRIYLLQSSLPNKRWHDKTYEEYKSKVTHNLATSIFFHFDAFGKESGGHKIYRMFVNPQRSRGEFNLLNKTKPNEKILKDNKFLFILDEWEEYKKKNKYNPIFTQKDVKEFGKKMLSSIYVGINIRFQKSPTTSYDRFLPLDKWESCYSKYRLDAKYIRDKNDNRKHPIPLRTKCFKGYNK